MAAIDYSGILDQTAVIFRGDSRTSDARVYVEEDPQFGAPDAGKTITILLADRRPSTGQAMAAGKRQRYDVRLSIWCAGFDLESFQAAATKRDALLAQVELVLMANQTLGGKVAMGWLDGGNFLNARDGSSNAYIALAETVFVGQVSAINT